MGQTTSLGMGRLLTPAKSKGYDQLKWLTRDSLIVNPMTDKPVFEQRDVEFPEGWSQNSINIVAQKYFTGTPGTADREDSLKKLIDRVVDTTTRQGVQEGYFEPASPRTSARSLNTFWLPNELRSTRQSGLTSVFQSVPNRLVPALFWE